MTIVGTDALRLEVNGVLEPARKGELGQFMTPSELAEFMATLFDDRGKPATLLDAGAGIGSLALAVVKRLQDVSSVEAWEIDPVMQAHLERNLRAAGVLHVIHRDDFIEAAVKRIALGQGLRYTHCILNPPYKKIRTDSIHRRLLSKVQIETVNLYAAFVALCVLLMQDHGQVVAIVPRSFCNGPYYKPFRELLLKTCSIERIHVFESRTNAFKDDQVLQENVIIKVVRGKPQGNIVVSTSQDQHLRNYVERKVPFSAVVKPNDTESFIHIPIEDQTRSSGEALFLQSLTQLGLEVSTGPVVDFRLKAYWLEDPTPNSVPLLYPNHFAGGIFQYPKAGKKPNALVRDDEVSKWLMPNGCYVLVKRFSSKEERRRVVAYVINRDDVKCDYIGFENHWNVFHFRKRGIDPLLANGMACFLNSSDLDKHFRVFSGHTQVNAADLRNMRYPRLDFLKAVGKLYRSDMTQDEIDTLMRQAR
jgi:adenine-specific DNA-methyltransferase